MALVDGFLAILPVTASTLTIALVLLVLLGRHGLAAAWALVAAWFVGAWLLLWLAMLGVGLTVPAGGGFPPPAQIGLGVAAVTLGAVVLGRRRARGGGSDPGLARMARLADGLTPVRSAALGFTFVALSPRQWLFLIPAAAAFTAADVPGGVVWLPLAGAAVASLGVVAPVVLAMVTERTNPHLMRRARRWWVRDGDVAGAVVALAVGVVLVLTGTVAFVQAQ